MDALTRVEDPQAGIVRDQAVERVHEIARSRFKAMNFCSHEKDLPGAVLQFSCERRLKGLWLISTGVDVSVIPHFADYASLALVARSHCCLDVVTWVYFLARIEDVVRVADVLGLFEDLKHFLCEEFREVWGADDAIVVFTTDVAVILGGCCEELL